MNAVVPGSLQIGPSNRLAVEQILVKLCLVTES